MTKATYLNSALIFLSGLKITTELAFFYTLYLYSKKPRTRHHPPLKSSWFEAAIVVYVGRLSAFHAASDVKSESARFFFICKAVARWKMITTLVPYLSNLSNLMFCSCSIHLVVKKNSPKKQRRWQTDKVHFLKPLCENKLTISHQGLKWTLRAPAKMLKN